MDPLGDASGPGEGEGSDVEYEASNQKDKNELNFVRSLNFHLHLLRREEKIDRQLQKTGLLPPKDLLTLSDDANSDGTAALSVLDKRYLAIEKEPIQKFVWEAFNPPVRDRKTIYGLNLTEIYYNPNSPGAMSQDMVLKESDGSEKRSQSGWFTSPSETVAGVEYSSRRGRT